MQSSEQRQRTQGARVMSNRHRMKSAPPVTKASNYRYVRSLINKWHVNAEHTCKNSRSCVHAREITMHATHAPHTTHTTHNAHNAHTQHITHTTHNQQKRRQKEAHAQRAVNPNLKPSCERSILLDILPVLVKSSRTDASAGAQSMG